MEAVEYSTRFAVGLFYEEGVMLDLPANISYVNNDPVFRYYAVDNQKRNRRKIILSSIKNSLKIMILIFFCVSANFPPSVCVHTSVPFGVQNADKTIAEIEPVLMKALQASFPNLLAFKPASIKIQKWKYSQVSYIKPGLDTPCNGC